MNNTALRTKNLFLIGAGFTRAVFSEAPLNKNLLSALCTGATTRTLKKYYRECKTKDIEILLTRLDLDILAPKRPRLTGLQQVRKEIEQQLAGYFERFRFVQQKLEEHVWLDRFAKEVFRRKDAIVSLNYDCFLEGLLDQHEMWCPSTGYGAVQVDVPGTLLSKRANLEEILIYKIHGSENFHTSDATSGRVDLNHIALAVEGGQIYPRSGRCSNLGVVGGRPYIIAPSFVKAFYPQIDSMIIGALEAARQARDFVIIGCGLRPEDGHLWLLLTSFLFSSPNRRKLIVADCQADTIMSKVIGHYQLGDDAPVKVESIGQNVGLNKDTVDRLIEILNE